MLLFFFIDKLEQTNNAMFLMDVNKINYVDLPHPEKLLIVESLDYENPYDYKKMHRHEYFEIIFITEGTGRQLIDFDPYDMQMGDIYTIYPGQVHIMYRECSNGLLIQFRKDIFEYIHPLKHYHLFFKSRHLKANAELFKHLIDTTLRIKEILQQGHNISPMSIHKAYSYLQIILLSLAELNNETVSADKENYLIEEYLSLVSNQIHSKKKVAEYCQLLGCTTEKLNDSCKKKLGKTALEIIHEELLLEIRRLLLLNELSLKEIAFTLNFDTQGNFNAFIKGKTGLTPGELQQSVLEIYK